MSKVRLRAMTLVLGASAMLLVGITGSGGYASAAAGNSDLRVTDSVAGSTIEAIVGGTFGGQSFTVTNLGPDTATNVTITLTLPAFVSIAAAQGSSGGVCTGNTCNFGSLGAYGQILALIRLNADAAGTGTITYSASADQTDPNLANNGTTRVAHALGTALTQTHSSPATALSNTPFDLGAVITNAGPGSAQNVTFTQRLAGNFGPSFFQTALTYVSATTSQGSCTTAPGTIQLPNSTLAVTDVTCTIGALAVGGQATVTIRTKWNGSNTLRIGQGRATATEAQGAAIFWSAIDVGFADVTLDDATLAPNPVQIGNTVSYTMTGRNNGPDTAKAVRLRVSFDASVTFVSAVPTQGSCSYTSTYYTVDCALGDVPNGATYSATLTLTATSVSSLTTFLGQALTDSKETATYNNTRDTWLRIIVCSIITVGPTVLPSGTVGAAYSEVTNATGGSAPYSFTAGSLAPGLTLAPGGRLSGTPTGDGTFTFTITATDQNGCAGSAQYNLVVVRDTTPPSITAPAAVTVEATTAAGAIVADLVLGTAIATDAVGPVSVSRTGLPAGNQFPLGSTTLTYTATDGAGNHAAATQLVTVVDTTPPSITAPAAVTVEASSPLGAAVSFAARAIDNVGVTSFACAPASGSIFPIGPSSVLCTARDAAGNTATATISVRVRGATDLLRDLSDRVRASGLPNGTATSLDAKLQAAIASFARGNTNPTCNQLSAFINEVQAQSGKRNLSPAQGTDFIDSANRIRSVLGCR